MSDESVRGDRSGPAFPIPGDSDGQYGMSLREYVATKTLAAIISNPRYMEEIVVALDSPDSAQRVFRGVARCAIGHADALLDAFKGGGK